MRSKDICAVFNHPDNKENQGMEMIYSPDKNPNKETRVFEIIHKEENESICRVKVERLRTKKYNLHVDVGPKDEVRMKFVWENGKIRFYENQGNPEFIDATYQKLKEWMLYTEAFTPIFMKLNELTWDLIHDNVNPILKDFAFKKDVPYEKFSLYEELRFDNLTDFFNNYNIKQPKLKLLIKEKAKDVEALIRMVQLFQFFLNLEIDINYMVNYFETLVKLRETSNNNSDLTKFKFLNKQNFRRFCLDCEEALAKGTVNDFFSHIGDIDRLANRVIELNPKAELPKVDNFTNYHNVLSRMVVDEETKRESAPYEWSEEEKDLHDFKVDEWQIKLPVSKPDLRMWGNMQSHCIGTYNWTGNCKLISFWKNDTIYSCLEIRRDGSSPYAKFREHQHRAKRNTDPQIPADIKNKLFQRIWDCWNVTPKPNEKDQGYLEWIEKENQRKEWREARLKREEEAAAAAKQVEAPQEEQQAVAA